MTGRHASWPARQSRVKTSAKSAFYRKLPSVDELLRGAELAELAEREGRAAVTEAARQTLARLRKEISSGHLDPPGVETGVAGLPAAVVRRLRQSLEYSLRPLINATGVILHTNLGRAPLSSDSLRRIVEVAGGYSNLEFDLAAGERGKRDVHVRGLFERLLAAEGARNSATVVVNNNAAAVLLALNTLAEGGEVIVSRGELVEIGGSFRIPEIMAKSGAVLREVGTTNRTRLADYQRAINQKTKLLLRVHRSNFQIVGFTEQPRLEDLVKLARKHRLPVMEDLGSGALFDLRSVGVEGEPGVAASLRAGVDVVTYSGDKLLGGPQAGMLSGKPARIARIRSNPLFRALRVSKLIYAALEATLLAYLRQDHDSIPALRMMRMDVNEISIRASALAETLQAASLRIEIVAGESVIGGGSTPGASLPTVLLAVAGKGLSADQLAARLRAAEPPVIARVEEGRVLLDLRTVFPEEDAAVAAALTATAK
jgi:L-seryl-tRNA(Ser) seleniumtransferase